MSRIAQNISSFKAQEVDTFFKTATCIFKNAGLTLLCAPSSSSHGRVLIVTPRRIGNAPQRNKIRRQIRAIFYQQKLYNALLDCAFIIRKSALAYSFDELLAICKQVQEYAAKN